MARIAALRARFLHDSSPHLLPVPPAYSTSGRWRVAPRTGRKGRVRGAARYV